MRGGERTRTRRSGRSRRLQTSQALKRKTGILVPRCSRPSVQRVHLAIVAVDVDRVARLEFSMSPVLAFSCTSRRSFALRYVTTTAVPLAVTISIEPFLAHGLVVEVDADDRVGSGVPGSLDHLADREILGLLQLALVGGGTPSDNVADAGEHVPEGVRAQDRLAGYDPLVVVDVPVLKRAGGRQQHALPPVCT